MNETKLQSPTPDLNHSTQSDTLLSVSMKEEMKEEAEDEEEEEEEEKYHPSLPSSPSNTSVMPPSSPYSSFNNSYSPQRSITPPSPQNPTSAIFPPFSPLNSTPPPYCNSSLSFSSSQLPHSPQSPHHSSGTSSYACSPSLCRSPPPPHSPPASPCHSPPPASPYTPGDPTCTPPASRSTPVSIPSTPVTPNQPPDSPHSQEDSSVIMASVQFASSPHRSQSSSQPAPTTPPEQEVVDVESEEPCVVDLTCEEDETDEVNVVEVVLGEPSVIYMGTETRRPRRHNQTGAIANLPPRPERPRAAHPTSSTSSSSNNNNNNNYASHRPSESNTFNSTSTNNTFNSSNNTSNTFNSLNNNNNLNLPVNISINNQNNNLDFHNTNLLFGNLLDEDLSVETVEEYGPSRPGPTRPSPLYPMLRDFRLPARHSRQSRSRSPQLPDYNRDRDAPRTPEFLQELDDLLAEMEGRMPPPAQPQASAPQILPLHQQQQPLTAAQMVAQEHCNRVANLMATQPLAPPSPPPREQPTISCMVCLDSLATIQASSRTMCSTNCGHLFCSPCITEVVKQKKQCPVCRKKLTKKQYHPLFI
ncbi:hypothetical protein Pmani_000920 [Petrolisthes manimaculis]|uniref:RING-type domain-containing protein n=1 Tax=Petrolisthes manimaculis TaxID=1843537 RepID=A0AAE1QLG4_9EUCA|nr:hypothetical protein Pmani_000920 [Petrolisthes manimaculis]